MDRNEVNRCMIVLVAAAVIGFGIVIVWNNVFTQVLFLVIMALAFIGVVRYHRKDNVYYCMKCGQKYKIGLIPDLVCETRENGDKILKCKKCKIKVNLRNINKKEEEGKSD